MNMSQILRDITVIKGEFRLDQPIINKSDENPKEIKQIAREYLKDLLDYTKKEGIQK